MDVWGQTYGVPSVAEKGYLDVELRVETPGGHSSVPRKLPTYSSKEVVTNPQPFTLVSG